MNKATQIWNRALDDYGLERSSLGDNALAAMLLAHGLAMNGGVLHAVEVMDEAQLAAAKTGYRFFGLEPVADLLSRAKDALGCETGDSLERERCAVGDIDVVLLEEDDYLSVLEPQMDSEYARYIPDDSALFERFERQLAANPDDFTGL
jgi:hypothetical protein